MLISLGQLIKSHSSVQSGSTPAYLDSVIDSVCCDLDATIAASYSGTGQTWANLIASPADGAAQTAYDFYLGADGLASTNDPTFNGTAGDAAAYWGFDGGDFFQIAGGNTALLRDAHKTTGGPAITVGWAFKTPSSLSNFFGMGTAGATADHGFRLFSLGGGDDFRWYQTTGLNAITLFTAAPTIVADTDYLFLASFDYTAGSFKYWLNSTTGVTETLVSNASTTNAADAFQLGSAGSVAPVPSGFRTYGFYIFNEILDNTKAAAIINHINARHGRTYA